MAAAFFIGQIIVAGAARHTIPKHGAAKKRRASNTAHA
jgi:hypothetical protein